MLAAVMLLPFASQSQNDCSGLTIPYAENFDAYSGSATSTSAPSGYPNITLPDCWSFINMSTSTTTYPQVFLTSTTSYAVSGNCLFFKSSSSTPLYAILPDVGAQTATWQLSFQYRNEGTSASNGTLIVGVMSDPTDASSFVAIQTLERITAKTLAEVIIPAGTVTGNARLAFCYQGGTANNYYAAIDNVALTFAPACLPISNLAVSDITSTNATLTWSGNAPGYTVYEYANADSNGFMTTDTFFVFNTLLPNTAYTFGVVSDCGADGESSMRSVSFRTNCAAMALPWTCGFETDEIPNTTAATALPWCSSRYVNPEATSGTTYPYSYSTTYAHSGSRALYYYGSTTATYPEVMAFILPEVDVNSYPMNANRVTFWASMSSTSYSKNVYVYTLSNPADFSTATLIDSVHVSGTTNNLYSVPLTSSLPTNSYVALVVLRGSGNLYIDDVTLEEMPSCVEVSNLEVSATTAHSVTLSWDDTLNNGATYTILGLADGNTTVIASNVTGTSYTVDNLAANTNYYFGVQANCNAGDATVMTVAARTECESFSTPYTWNFDDQTSGTPYCWTKVGSGTAAVYSSTTYAHSGSYSLKFNGSTSNLIALPTTVDEISTLQLTFWTRPESFTNSSCGTFSVGYMTDVNDATSFVELANYAYNEFTAIDQKSVTFAGAPAGARMAMRHNAGSTAWYWFVDDVTIDEAPSCLPVSGIVLDAQSANSADIHWNGTGASAYEVEVRQNDVAITTVSVTVDDTTASITGLAIDNDYQIVVRAICGSDYSPWSSPLNLHIGFCNPNPTSVDNSGITSVVFGGMTNTTSHPTSSPYYIDNTTMAGSVPAGTTATVDITYATGYTYGTIIWVDWNNSLSFDADEVVYRGTSENTNPTVLTATFNIPETQALGNYRMRIAGADSYFDSYVSNPTSTPNPCFSSTYAIAEDYTLTVTEAPSCFVPANVTVSNITATGATLTWQGDAAGYTIYDMSDTSVYQYANDTTVDIYALDPMTQYTFGVSSDCGSSESDIVTITFNTACSAVALPFTEGFEATSATRNCWTTDGPGSWLFATGDYSTSTGSYEGSLNAVINHSSTGNATKLISPVLDNVTNGVSLTFAHIQRSWSGDQDELYVYYRTDANSQWQQVAYYDNNITTWTVDNVIIPGTVYQVAFEMLDGYGYGVAIDSIVIEDAPNCVPVVNLAVDSVTGTSVFLSWTGDAASYTIVGETGSVVATGIATTNYEITGLTPSTTYTFGVVANCGSDNSDTVAITATTGCGGTSCFVEINGTDSYGDGWNGNAINLIQNGAVIHTFTLGTGESLLSEQVSVCGDLPVSFQWVSGNYPDEVSFEIKTQGIVSYTCNDATALTDGTVFHTIASPCPSCSPAIITVDNATENSVTISWTGNGVSYDVYNGNTYVASVTTNTYTFTGLNASTNYTFGVQTICTGSDTSAMAVVTAATSCGVISTFPYVQDFAAAPACWDTIDADGDGYNWSLISGAVHSASYENYVGALTPDNWLITPQFQLAANTNYEVTWNADPQDVLYPAEHYGLYVSTTTADTTAFTLLQEWTLTDAGHVPVVDLSTYAGQTIYLAFRHWNCTDMYRIAIDNFQLREAAGANQITVTLTQNNPMYGSVAGGGVYNIGDSVTVTATPATGYQFLYWISSMGAVVANNPYTFLASTDITLQAVFGDATATIDSMQVTVAVNDATMGTTIPAPGVHYFITGQQASVVAVPNEGYHLEGWSIMVTSEGETLLDTTVNYAVEDVFDLFDGWTVGEGDGDYVWNVTANFAGGTVEIHDSLTVITACNNPAWGTVMPSVGTHYYALGDNAVIGAIPNDGYYISMAYVSFSHPVYGEEVDTLYAEDFEDEPMLDTIVVDEEYIGVTIDIKVVFAPVGGVNYYNVTVNYNSSMGTVEGIPTEAVAEGTEVTLTAIPNDGYHFARWSNGETTATITFTVTSDVTLEAFFERNTGIEDATAVDFNVYGKEGIIMLQGAEGREVYVFDVNGRMLHHTATANMTESYNAPATGLYIVKVVGVGTKRVVIVR